MEMSSRYVIDKGVDTPESLCLALEPYFKDVEAVIHAGDITDLRVLEALKRFGNVYAVAGNMDPANIHQELGEKRIIELNGYRIGLMHGWGSKEGLSFKIRQHFKDDNVDCIVFGHSHNPYDRIEDNILMFNPGSPTDRRFADYRSIGILHLEDRIWGEHITLE